MIYSPIRVIRGLHLLFCKIASATMHRLLLILFLCSSAFSQQLGRVSFSTSCSAEAQPTFDKGVALLHSFQYATADAAFAEAAKKDPKCAMAYWGRAMSLFHQLWNWPSDSDMSKGREYIQQAKKIGAKTERERLYIHAADDFFNTNASDQSSRVAVYSNDMASIYKAYPDDGEAAAFYALSLISWAPSKDEKANREKAISILKELFAKQPDHPGAAHYLIHAADTPELAPQGLEAARRYAQIAPSSAHALHMPAHIFSRLGLWQDMIDSNLASVTAASQATRNKVDDESSYQLHAMKYLQYAYEQTGKNTQARQTIEAVKDVPGIKPGDIANDGGIMQALYALETHQWNLADAIAPDKVNVPFGKMRIYWARAIAESHLGNKKQAEKDANSLRDLIKARHHDPSQDPQMLEAEAWVAFAKGKADKAIKTMREAVKHDEFGVDSSSLPASELLGDLLTALHRPAEALEAYEASLKIAPNRFNSLYGAGQAAELSGKDDKARQYYAALIKLADPQSDRPELQQVKVYLAKK
jgi:tetratricopeptide repeat protein